MGEVYREPRYREYDEPQNEDGYDGYKRTTVRRYKVKPGREEQYESVEVDDDYAPRHSRRDRDDYRDEYRRDDYQNYDRRERSDHQDDRRSAYYERDVERDYGTRDQDRGRRDRDSYENREGNDYDDRRPRYPRHEGDVRVERRVEDRYEDGRGHDYDHYRKETEYYSRASPPPQPSPVVIRHKQQEPQKIIVEEAPPTPVVIPRHSDYGAMVVRGQESNREVARREPRREEEDYYYRHERRGDVGPYRGDDYDRERERDREYAMARYDRYRRDQGYSSDEDDYYHHRRTVIRRERSESPTHHKRSLAAGALAGAGLTALMNSRRGEHGEMPENRGRKMIAGGALGALGTEAVRRAHSAYEERYGDGHKSPEHHDTLKKGLGVAAVALAAVGAAKYYQSNKEDKEEASRGRSRRRSRSRHSRHSSGGGVSLSRSGSRGRSKSRGRSMSTAAKAALGTAATAGIVQHFRDKSKARDGQSRSKSRLRRAAEIGGAAAAAGVATNLWKKHKGKDEAKSREHSRGGYSDNGSEYDRRSRGRSVGSQSRSRSRSMARSRYGDNDDPEQLGLVEYGNDPLGPPGAARGYESEAEERRRRRRRRRDKSAMSSDAGSDGEDTKRSKSRLRDMAAAGAAAFGIKEFKDRKDQEKKEKQRDRRSRERDESRERSRDRSRNPSRRPSRGPSRRHRDEDPDGYFDDRPQRAGSPPVTSGGAYYPPYPSTPGGAPLGQNAFGQYPGQAADYHSYIPQDYTGYPPPPPPGPPPLAGGYPAAPPGPPAPGPPPPGPPPAGGNYPPDHVSYETQRRSRGIAHDGVEEGKPRRRSSPAGTKTPPQASKSVSFTPLSPQSSRTIKKHRRLSHDAAVESSDESDEDEFADGPGGDPGPNQPGSLFRTVSEPVVDRPTQPHDSSGPIVSDEDIEYLPDRFDSQGRPLGGRSTSHGPYDTWTTRSGQFEKRRQRRGGWDVSGSWQVGGTDPDAVDRMARAVTGALDGKKGWMGLVGDLFSSGIPGGGRPLPPDDDQENRGRYRRR